MIKEISIKNFQSHKDSHIELSDGVNIIVGASDSGKSSLIRAIKWLATNRPSGESIRSTWGGKTEVEIFTESLLIEEPNAKKFEHPKYSFIHSHS